MEKEIGMTRAEFCIAQSAIAAIRNISSMYESNLVEQEIHLGEEFDRIAQLVRDNTSKWQRENAAQILNRLVKMDLQKEV